MRRTLMFILLFVSLSALFMLALVIGPVGIDLDKIYGIFAGEVPHDDVAYIIIHESRLPMALTALFAGAGLSVAGLLLQTTFQNPLAGPSILGISSGSSLGAALVLLCGGATVFGSSIPDYVSIFGGAMVGAGVIMLVLLAFSTVLNNAMALLIAGVMISYLASSLISMLNFFAPADGIRSFVIWGMGSYSGVSANEIPLFAVMTLIFLAASLIFIKPLDALLLSERYAENMGYSMRRLRSMLLIVSGLLTASVTAFCGPIGFIGLIVPHLARMIFATSRHYVVIPATMLCGAVVSLFCCVMSVLPKDFGVLPINAITPVVGVPVILYIILFRKKLKYFN